MFADEGLISRAMRSAFKFSLGFITFNSLPQRQPAQHSLLFRNQRLHALTRISHHLRKLRLIKRLPLGSSLHFHHLVSSRHHKIHIHIGARVFFIAKIEQDFSIDNSHTHRATKSRSGTDVKVPASTNFSSASPNATNAPVMEAVRVPPSA